MKPRIPDRDVYTSKARAAVPEPVFDDATGRYEGEQLAQIRSRRPTEQRIAHIEKAQDEIRAEQKRQAETSVDMLVMLGEIRVELRTTVDFIKLSHGEQHKTERARIGSRTKIMVALFTAAGTVAGAIAALTASGCA
jgi:hypothetical protein